MPRRSTDGGQTFIEVLEGLPDRVRSDDAGQSWHEVSSGLGARTVILDLAASPFSADLLFAGTAGQGLFRLETGSRRIRIV